MANQDERLEKLEDQLGQMREQLQRMEAQQRELRDWLGKWLCAPENCKKAEGQ
ncbi:MAG: hypothetical protein HY303_04675 [Candidatus Wallbacteria bacterium]|nr:hypothetical protein [Candidatus Wallbacteria bacterium]